MTLDTKIRIEERPPFVPSGPRTLTRERLQRLMLIVYDTAAIATLHERDKEVLKGIHRWYVPAKYCLTFQEGFDDSDIVAQAIAGHDKYRAEVVWFNRLRDLPIALAALKKKLPDKPIPDQVSGVHDYPTGRVRHEPGDSLVTFECKKKRKKQ